MSAQAVREAVSAGDYIRASRLFDEYARSLPIEQSALEEVAELMRWTKVTILCARAHAEARIHEARAGINVAAAYGG